MRKSVYLKNYFWIQFYFCYLHLTQLFQKEFTDNFLISDFSIFCIIYYLFHRKNYIQVMNTHQIFFSPLIYLQYLDRKYANYEEMAKNLIQNYFH